MPEGILSLEARIRMMVEGAEAASSQLQSVARNVQRLAEAARAGGAAVSPVVSQQIQTAQRIGIAGEAYLGLMENIVRLRRVHIPTLQQAIVDTFTLSQRLQREWPALFGAEAPFWRMIEALPTRGIPQVHETIERFVGVTRLAAQAMEQFGDRRLRNLVVEQLRGLQEQIILFGRLGGLDPNTWIPNIEQWARLFQMKARQVSPRVREAARMFFEGLSEQFARPDIPPPEGFVQFLVAGIPEQMQQLNQLLIPLYASLRHRLANVVGGAGEAARAELNRQFRAIQADMRNLARMSRQMGEFLSQATEIKDPEKLAQFQGRIARQAISLAEAYRMLGARVQQFVQSAQNIDRVLRPIERPILISAMRRFGDALIEVTRQTWPVHQLQMALQMTGMTLIWMGGAAFGAAMGLAWMAQNMDRLMRATVIAADIPDRLIGPFRDQVLAMAEAFGVAPQTVGAAMTIWLRATGELIQTEGDINRFADRFRDALALAALSGEDVAAIIPAVVQAVGQFGLSMDYASRIMAGMYRVAKATASSVSEVGDALRFVGPVAAQFGDSIEETFAVMEIGARAGLRGGLAGRALRQFYIQLAEASERAQELNLILFGRRQPFFDERGFVGIERAIEMIAERTRNLTAEQRNYYLSTISTANELPLLIRLVEEQARFQEYAARFGMANANAIRAQASLFRGEITPEARLYAKFLEEIYGIQLDFRTAMEMFARDQERYAENTATRWDRAMRRIEQAALRMGLAFRDALLPNLESASRFVEGLARAMEEAGVAGRIATALISSAVVLGVAGALIRGLGVALRFALTHFILTESLAQMVGILWGDAAKVAIQRALAAAVALGPIRIGIQPFLMGAALGGTTAALMGAGWAETLAASLLGGLAVALVPQLVSLIAQAVSKGIMAGVSAATPAMAALSSMISAAVSSGVLAGIPAALSRIGRIVIPVGVVATVTQIIPSDQGPLAHQALFPEAYRRAAALPPGPERERAFRELFEMYEIARRMGISSAQQWRALMEQFGRMSEDVGYQAYRAGERMALDVARGLQEGLSRSEVAYQAYRAGERMAGAAMLDVEMSRAFRESLPLFARLFDLERDFQRNRERVIRDAARDILRAEEDYARRRARLLREIQQARAGDPEEEADRARERERAFREFYQRLADMDEDHRRRMLQMEQDHRDRVMDLVAERNALALVREIRDYEKRRAREEEEYRIRRERMIRDFNERMALEEEESRIRRERRVRDLMERLREMDEEHRIEMARRRQDLAERLALMEEQFQEERRQLLRQIVMRIYARQLEEQMMRALHEGRMREILAALDPVYRQVLEEEMNRLGAITSVIQQILSAEQEGEEERTDVVNLGTYLRMQRTAEGMAQEVVNLTQGHEVRVRTTQQGVAQEVQAIQQGGTLLARAVFNQTIEMLRQWMDYFNRLMNLQAAYFGFSLEGWNQYLQNLRRIIDELLRGGGGGGGGGRRGGPQPYQHGGYAEGGLAFLHPGEYVLPAYAVRELEQVLGGPITPFRVVAAVRSGGSTAITVPVTVQVMARGDPVDVRQVAREVGDRVMRELARHLR